MNADTNIRTDVIEIKSVLDGARQYCPVTDRLVSADIKSTF